MFQGENVFSAIWIQGHFDQCIAAGKRNLDLDRKVFRSR